MTAPGNRQSLRLDTRTLVKFSEGFSGSEIEQALIDTMFECFEQGREIDTRAVIAAAGRTVPLSVTMSEQIDRMRQWAGNRARPASAGN